MTSDPALVWVVAVAAGVLGLAVGSFLNVVAYRVPIGASVIRPPSACPACGHPIRARDNLPVVGWLALRGRCRDCQEPISVRYPLVEVGTAVLFALTVWVVGVVWSLPAHLFFVGATSVLILTDLDHKRIPNRILYPSIPIAVLLLGVGGVMDQRLGDFGRALLAAPVYFGFLLVIALVARGGFGMGDVKLAALLGLFLGYASWESLAVGAFLAFLIGGTISIVLLATGRRGRRDAIPFGPSLIVAAWIALPWGASIARWYLG